MKIVERCLTDLKPYQKNARIHSKVQINDLAKSIQQFGFNIPILIDETRTVLAGHARLMAAQQLCLSSVPTISIEHLSDVQKKAFILVDNRLSDRGRWDEKLVEEEIKLILELEPDVDIPTFIMDEYKEYDDIDRLESNDSVNNTIDVIVQKNDLIFLGLHKVWCGDCTDKDKVQYLLEGKTVDSLQTDPPYGVDYVTKTNKLQNLYNKKLKEKHIENDNTFNIDLYLNFLAVIPFSSYNTIFLWGSAIQTLNVLNVFKTVGLTCANILIWDKGRFILSRSDYNYATEFCFYGWKTRHKFYGGNKRSNVFYVEMPNKNVDHPTMKPISLIERTIRDGTTEGMLVFDPFLGSGTTLLAAHNTKRLCYGCEIEPSYCDVIIKRFKTISDLPVKILRGNKIINV